MNERNRHALNRGVNTIYYGNAIEPDDISRLKAKGSQITFSSEAASNVHLFEAKSYHLPSGREYALFDNPLERPEKAQPLKHPIYNIVTCEEKVELYPNTYIQTIQLNPNKLVLYNKAVEGGHVSKSPYLEEIIVISAAVLFNQATANDIAKHADTQRPGQSFGWSTPQPAYHLNATDFYVSISQDMFPALEIHDFVLHPAQFRHWPGFFFPLTELAAYTRNHLSPKHRLSRFVDYAFFASAEYGAVGAPAEKATAVGCLLYTYPRKNPMRLADIDSLSDAAKLLTRWEALRASSSLARRDNSYARKIGDTTEWHKKLGYRLPNNLTPHSQPINEALYIEPIATIEDPLTTIDYREIAFPESQEDLQAVVVITLKEEYLLLDIAPHHRNNITSIIDKFTIEQEK